MPKLTVEQAYAFNKKTGAVSGLPVLISVDKFADKSDRTLALGLTGSESGGRIELKHVYFREGDLHVFSYFIGPDDRFLGGAKFAATTLAADKLFIPNGVEWSTADSSFVIAMAKANYPLYLIPLTVWGKRPVELLEETYYGHVPEVTCKPHDDSLDF